MQSTNLKISISKRDHLVSWLVSTLSVLKKAHDNVPKSLELTTLPAIACVYYMSNLGKPINSLDKVHLRFNNGTRKKTLLCTSSSILPSHSWVVCDRGGIFHQWRRGVDFILSLLEFIKLSYFSKIYFCDLIYKNEVFALVQYILTLTSSTRSWAGFKSDSKYRFSHKDASASCEQGQPNKALWLICFLEHASLTGYIRYHTFLF